VQICFPRCVSDDRQWQESTGLAWPSRCDSLRGFHLFRTATLRSRPDSHSRLLGAQVGAGRSWRLWRCCSCSITKSFNVRAHFPVREIWIVLGFAAWQWLMVRVFAGAGARAGWLFTAHLRQACFAGSSEIGSARVAQESVRFLGISYVTFRALDVVFCVSRPGNRCARHARSLMFLFFFPTISAGPIDRYRRFLTDWKKKTNAR